MAKLHITDEANLFRVEIEGRFSGETVERVRQHWEAFLTDGCSRRFTVDISQMTGYDPAGSRLLREMYNHGVYISARTPRALIFLAEIAAPATAGPTLVYKAPAAEVSAKQAESAPVAKPATVVPLTRAAAAGE